jgi:transcriptional regulator of met regulon
VIPEEFLKLKNFDKTARQIEETNQPINQTLIVHSLLQGHRATPLPPAHEWKLHYATNHSDDDDL